MLYRRWPLITGPLHMAGPLIAPDRPLVMSLPVKSRDLNHGLVGEHDAGF
jgi:hypothetical protein